MTRTGAWSRLFLVCLLCLPLAACKRDAVRVSVEYLEFGETANGLRFDLWNGEDDLKTMKVTLEASDDWITLEPSEVESAAPQSTDGGQKATLLDKKSIVVTADRTRLKGGRAEGRITIRGARAETVEIPVYISPPYEAVGVSTQALDFGADDTVLSLEAWNTSQVEPSPMFTVTPNVTWIRTSRAFYYSSGTEDRVLIAVSVERDRIPAPGPQTAELVFSSAGFADKRVTVTVFKKFAAIAASNSEIDFGREYAPRTVEVWNSGDGVPGFRAAVVSGAAWLRVTPASLSLSPPVEGVPVKTPVLFTLDRASLPEGTHQSYVDIVPDRSDIAPFRIAVSAVQDETTMGAAIHLENVQERYSAPYLLDFVFDLVDAAGKPVIAEPAQFSVEVFEGAEPAPPETVPLLRRAAVRQLRCEMVLDYSLAMQEEPGAVAAMEAAASDIFLDALTPETLVGVTAFCRDDEDAARIADFTTDRDYLRARMAAIQEEYVAGFASGARLYDAVYGAVQRFSEDDAAGEERYVVLFSRGRDTSSLRRMGEVVSLAAGRRVKIMALGFGDIGDYTLLDNLALRTGGRRFTAEDTGAVAGAFEEIIQRLEARYVLRWATLRRDTRTFLPRFLLSLEDKSVLHAATALFRPSDHAGEVRRGALRLVPSGADGSATLLFRADYMPRYIQRIRVYIATTLPFTASVVGAADGGVLDGWTLTQEPDPEPNAWWITLESAGAPAAFADFGPLFRLDYADIPDEATPLVEDIWIENDYEGGQFLEVVNFD
ncbi:MAG TPA: vWA domain-containing protein [Candidatus Hydrogenedentes bacterium]|nr:vWA domain-containing protein [Candidatus Hydrogenedentota bacterium]HQL94556.1 vWA domain-containing protein [Candidatus Hydrogenedentota bacterium]